MLESIKIRSFEVCEKLDVGHCTNHELEPQKLWATQTFIHYHYLQYLHNRQLTWE